MALITLADPVDVSLSGFDAWTDIDITSVTGYAASVTGVVIRVINTGSSNLLWGLRKNGSTDARTGAIVGNTPGTHLMMTVGVDSSGIFEGYADSDDINFEVVGMLTGDTFFTNAVDVSTGSTSSWVDVDIASSTGGDTATHAWVEWIIVGASGMGLRKNGSTDDRRALTWRHNAGGVGCDGSEIFEQWVASTGSDLFLMGYGTEDMTWNTNAVDRSTATEGSYEEITTPDAAAIAAVYDVYTTVTTTGSFAIRRTGSSVDSYRDLYLRAHWVVTLSGTGGTAEQKIESDDTDVFELAWWTSGAASYSLTLDQAAVTVSAQALTTRAARRLTLDPASITNTGQALALKVGYRLSLTHAALALGLQDVTLTYSEEGGYTLSLDPLSVALTAQAIGLSATRRIVADPAVVTVTAEAVGLRATRLLSLGPAQVDVTGQALSLLLGRRLSLDPASAAITAQALTPIAGRRLSLSAASLALTMGDLVFDDSGALIGIIALDGTYVPIVSLTGSSVVSIAMTGELPV